LPWRKKEIINRYVFQGLKPVSLAIAKISKHQYYQLKKHKTRIKPKFIECLYWVRWCRDDYFEYRNNPLMRLINQDLDTDYGHRKMTAKINWLSNQPQKIISTNERNSNAERKARKPSKTYVKYRKVLQNNPLKFWKWTSNLFG
jgi:hypothetical protein